MACGQALSADNNSKGEAGEMTKRPAVETLLIRNRQRNHSSLEVRGLSRGKFNNQAFVKVDV